jgi:imidazolonepropionase-like amidohydrolase
VTSRVVLGGALLAALAAGLLAAQSDRIAGDPSRRPGAIAFEGVRVLPMDSARALADQTVLVHGDRIVAMGPSGSIEIPDGALTVDGRGATLVPGLADLHVHLYSEADLLNYLAHGVTTVLDLNGSARTRAWRGRVGLGAIPGPTIYTAGPSLNGYPPGNPSFAALDDPALAAFEVRRQKAVGYDLLKMYSTLAPEVYRAVMEAAEAEGMAVVGHVPLQVGIEGALNAGQSMIVHGEEYWKVVGRADSTAVAAVIDATRAAGAWVTPNLSAIERILAEAADLPALLEHREAGFVSPAAYSEWLPSNNRYWGTDTARFLSSMRGERTFIRSLTARLSAAGVPLLLGTDSPVFGFAGASAHRELALLVDAGLTPYEALAAATREAGEFVAAMVGAEERFGRIAPGQRADLLLVEGDPLADVAALARIRGVMARGVWRTAEELGRLRAEQARRNQILHARVRGIDSLMDRGEIDAAVELYDATRAEHPGVDLIAETVFWTEGRALLRRDGWADEARRLLDLSVEAYPLSHAAWRGLADARAAAGDTAGAISALAHARELLPSDAGVLDRIARLEAARVPPAFAVAGVYRLATRAQVDGEQRNVALTLTLEQADGGWGGRVETDTPLPVLEVTEVAAGGDRLWVSAPFEDQTLALRLIVEGEEVRGWWNLGIAEQGVLRGRRISPGETER